MAETRNIKDLPKTDAMVSGDYFLIEAPAGTQLLAFDNFVIDEDNTTFGAEMQTNITTLSTSVTSVSADLDMNNDLGTLYIVNTSLTSSITGITNSLYGSPDSDGLTFENTINDFILNDNEVDTLGNERTLDKGYLHALSAMIADEVYTHVQAISSRIVGGTGLEITNGDYIYSDRLKYDSPDTRTDPSRNSGGLLGVVLETAMNSIDVYPAQTKLTWKSGADTDKSITFKVPNKYNVSVGSLQYTIEYGNEAQLADSAKDPETDPNPYNKPGSFVIVDYEQVDDGDQVHITHAWTIRRVGGESLTDQPHTINLHCKLISTVGTGSVQQVQVGG